MKWHIIETQDCRNNFMYTCMFDGDKPYQIMKLLRRGEAWFTECGMMTWWNPTHFSFEV